MLAAVLEAAPTHPNTGDCLAVPLRHVAGLLYAPHQKSPKQTNGAVPLFRLPGVFEPRLTELAECLPDVMIELTLDLKAAHYLVEWATPPAPGGGPSIALWMDGYIFYQIANIGGWEYGSPWPGLWQPVILMAGETVAIGGVWKDDGMMDALQSASISAQSYVPQDHHSPKRLKQAKAHARQQGGATPWEAGLWCKTGSNGAKRWVLQPPAFNYMDL